MFKIIERYGYGVLPPGSETTQHDENKSNVAVGYNKITNSSSMPDNRKTGASMSQNKALGSLSEISKASIRSINNESSKSPERSDDKNDVLSAQLSNSVSKEEGDIAVQDDELGSFVNVFLNQPSYSAPTSEEGEGDVQGDESDTFEIIDHGNKELSGKVSYKIKGIDDIDPPDCYDCHIGRVKGGLEYYLKNTMVNGLYPLLKTVADSAESPRIKEINRSSLFFAAVVAGTMKEGKLLEAIASIDSKPKQYTALTKAKEYGCSSMEDLASRIVSQARLNIVLITQHPQSNKSAESHSHACNIIKVEHRVFLVDAHKQTFLSMTATKENQQELTAALEALVGSFETVKNEYPFVIRDVGFP